MLLTTTVLAVLLAAGKNVDQQLLDAAKANNARRIAALTQAGANPDAKNDDGGWPALRVAAGEGALAAVKALIDAGANVDLADDSGNTALAGASLWGQTEIVHALLAAGADPNIADSGNVTPLMVANNAEIVRALLKAGAKLNVKDVSGETALHWFCSELGEADSVRALLAAGANVHMVPADGRTALMRARAAKRQDLVALLQEAGARR